MKKHEIILVGGGGHCKSCIDVIEAGNKYIVKGIIDLPQEFGKSVLNYTVIGNDDNLPKLARKGYHFLITLGHMGKSELRRKLFNIIKSNGGKFPVVVSPSARISKYAVVGEGTIIMHHCIINSDAVIGYNCIINNKALIEHDVNIGNDCHISTNANVNGNCYVSDNCLLGSSSTVKNGISIGRNITIGACSLVIRSIDEAGVYAGIPVKKIK